MAVTRQAIRGDPVDRHLDIGPDNRSRWKDRYTTNRAAYRVEIRGVVFLVRGEGKPIPCGYSRRTKQVSGRRPTRKRATSRGPDGRRGRKKNIGVGGEADANIAQRRGGAELKGRRPALHPRYPIPG